MTFMNNTANMKQFQLLKFINETSDDDHVVSKISITLRRDKIEAPFYMVTKIKISTCLDSEKTGLIHAMDVLNHHRMYNLAEENYNEIKELILNNAKSDEIKRRDKQLKLILLSRSEDEFMNIFNNYQELFSKIDNLIGGK